MRLFAAMMPPPEVLDALHEVVAAVPTPADPALATQAGKPHPEPHHKLFGRRHQAPEPPPEDVPPPPPLDWVPPTAVHLLVARFGNLTHDEAALLARTLQRKSASWPAPRLRLTGGAALEWPGDKSAWVGLAGDLEALDQIAQEVPQAARAQQLYVDRRSFRPLLRLGSINDHTTARYLEDLLAALDAFEGEPWQQQELSLVVPSESGELEGSLRTFRDVELGGEADAAGPA